MAELEARQVKSAVRTDFILSAEIMVIALNELTGMDPVNQAIVLALVGIVVTIGVYGLVATIVKMDDIGLRLIGRRGGAARFGRALVKAMPSLLTLLSRIGTSAMLWVGGGILIHGLAAFGLHGPEKVIHDIAHAVGGRAVGAWIITAICAGVVGSIAGTIVAGLLHLRPNAKH